MIPIRLSIDPMKPMIQKRYDYNRGDSNNNDHPMTLGSLLCEWVPQYFYHDEKDGTTVRTKTIYNDEEEEEGEEEEDSDVISSDNAIIKKNSSNSSEKKKLKLKLKKKKKTKKMYWCIAGVVPPLETSIIDLWLTLRHPDNFLYISVNCC
jgi:hypothetical protein